MIPYNRLYILMAFILSINLLFAQTHNIKQTDKTQQITITGNVMDAYTGDLPKGLITISEYDKWEEDVIQGSNNHTIADKNGYYTINIDKGGRLFVRANKNYSILLTDKLVHEQSLPLKLQPKPYTGKEFKLERPDISPEKIKITGIVTDKNTGKPIYFANIAEDSILTQKGGLRTTVTNKEGEFTMWIHKGNTIGIRHRKYETNKTRNIQESTEIKIALLPALQSLN